MSETLAPPARLHTASWVVYDLANTIYSATVTYLLARYMHEATGIGVVTTMSMIVAGVGTPLFASLADRTGRAGLYCTVTTLGCIAGMSFFGIGHGDRSLLVAYFLANVCYQAALVFYNSLLPSVATPRNMGLISGLGVGLGYLGAAFTLAILLPIQEHLGWQPAFLVGAGGFLLAALPCMALVRDRRPITPERVTLPLVRQEWSGLLGTVRRLPQQPALLWFLLANFFAVDVLNTAILFYGRFVEKCFEGMFAAGRLSILGWRAASMERVVMVAGFAVTVPALGFGLLLGFLADRLGSRLAFGVSIVCLAAGLAGSAFFAGAFPLLFLLFMCGFGGIGLAGIWTAGRKLLTELVPRAQVARYFGLYGVTNKVSVIGSTVFGAMMDGFGPRTAILSQIVPLALAFVCLHRMIRWERRLRAAEASAGQKERAPAASAATGASEAGAKPGGA